VITWSKTTLTSDKSLEKSALFVATLTSFMGPFTISSVNVALPAIQAEFSTDAVVLSWVATSFLLAMAVFLVPFGKVADIYGRKKIFTFSSLAALINYSATFALTFLLSLYLQYIKGIPPQYAGSILIAQPIVMAVFSPLAGRLSDRIEPRLMASAGMLITAIGLFSFVFIGAGTSKVLIVLTLAFLGFGFSLFSSPNMNAIMGSVEKRYLGIASGTVATMRLLGQMVSMAIAMVVFAVFIGREPISPANYGEFLKSVRVAFLIFSSLCTIGILFSMFRGEVRSDG
jgi:MFS family permease